MLGSFAALHAKTTRVSPGPYPPNRGIGPAIQLAVPDCGLLPSLHAAFCRVSDLFERIWEVK